ncbi:MAG TPA: primosomal protein N' [Verrucomicrobiota bacterium]|nr:primosomal protein N' [Verrucomicrobiales bacterium]HRI13240.1 primosomal protein N' [Verrucomicrobiota bacterium]
MVARVTLELALRREFDYAIPEELRNAVTVGSRVKVPLGHREVAGVVTALADSSSHTNLKPILRVLGEPGLVTPRVLELARWMAEYYCCPVEKALKSVLPEAVRQEEPGWRERLHVQALAPPSELPKLTARQLAIWNIIEEWRELPLQELVRLGETTAETVRKLEDKGLVRIAALRSERDPYALERFTPTEPLPLNPNQSQALATILAALKRPTPAATAANATSHTFLLHGVTGSGKTEIYLQAIAQTLADRKGAIVLVPEISLTPQTVERFKARFSSGPFPTLVAVLHSHLSAGERHDEWHKIREGRARIVIGARSAVFAPVEPLGLIIVDEEHEHSYKQEEAPRYHARDVAVVRGQREGAVVVLGSATPSLESYFNARRGKYGLLELPARVTETRLPVVRIVDLRQEQRRARGGAPAIFSNPLREAIQLRLERSEQTMLFLNRRGYSTTLQCEKCGFVAGCPNCSVSLTFHRQAQQLRCHICGHEAPVPTQCPDCHNPAIRYSGLGTERVEDVLIKLFPKARVKRMDSDTLQRKDDFRRVLTDFRTGKIDILVGTQMIAKGLHFPNVTLVGIVHADLSLHIPDFRAGERTFQLLTQVSGRAGRGDVEGEVFVQTFTPFHPAIQFARRHDYLGFYEQEIEFREQLKYPPWSRVALLTLKGRNEDKVKFTADHLRRTLETRLAGWRDLVIAGPGPAPLMRAESLYRYQLMLRTKAMARLSRELAQVESELSLPDDLHLTIDVDPVDLV